MYTHRRNLRQNENKLKTISLETSSGKVDQILGKGNKQWVMESTNSAPEMTEIYVDSLPGIRCVYLDVILPNWYHTGTTNTQQQTWYKGNQSGK